jgi:hypothetical protein
LNKTTGHGKREEEFADDLRGLFVLAVFAFTIAVVVGIFFVFFFKTKVFVDHF